MARPIQAADLPEDIARIAEAQVAAGNYASVEEVVRAGVEAVARMGRRKEDKLAALRAALEEGEQVEPRGRPRRIPRGSRSLRHAGIPLAP